MKTPIRPEPQPPGEQSDDGAGESTFSIVGASSESAESTFTGTVGAVSYGSVQAWYVRAVEGAPRLTEKGEQRVRDQLRRVQYDMSVALGTSPDAVAALAAGFERVHGAATRGYFLRWPLQGERLSSPAEVKQRVLAARDGLAQLASGGAASDRDSLLESAVTTLFELRPSDEAIRSVLATLAHNDGEAVGQERANIAGAQRALRVCRNRMIDSHLRIVLRELRHHMNSGAERRELLQEGNLGLLKAAEVYDETRAVPFSAYALTWIRSRMKRAVLRQRSQLHLPDRFRREISEVRRVGRGMSAALGREPTLEELAKEADYEPESLRRLLVRNAISSAFTSLQASSPNTGLGLEECLTDPSDLSVVDLLEERERLSFLEPALEQLEERERHVLSLRFGLADTALHTLGEAGKQLGVSAERVRQIEVKALEKLAEGLAL